MYDGAEKPVKKGDGTSQELSLKIVIHNGTGGSVTRVWGWRYTFANGKCGSDTPWDVWTLIYIDGPVNANYGWSTIHGWSTVVSQSTTFTDSGSQEVTTHIGRSYADLSNIKVTHTSNGSVQSTFTIGPKVLGQDKSTPRTGRGISPAPGVETDRRP